MYRNKPEKVLLAWSGGKDSMLALHVLQADPHYETVALLTTLAQEYRRISHHGVRERLLEQQAATLGLPLEHSITHKSVPVDSGRADVTQVIENTGPICPVGI
ncbi:MAG: hypothetical protein J5I81_14385 [Nitrococcus mobilis]|nr:hypothetical protein [Nitrococcus mobilis]